MKFENMESSKFDAFKADEIQNLFKIVGGEKESTTLADKSADCRDDKTKNGWFDGDTEFDFWYGDCPVIG